MLKYLLPIFLAFTILLPQRMTAQEERHGDGIDDVLQYTPYLAVFTLKACGVESASSWKRMSVNAGASFLLTAGVTFALKQSIHDRRPDGTDRKSFPSGHTAYAFAGATMLHKEYRRVSPWISVAGYSVAVITAADRIRRNRHEWDDVLVGAGIGILGTEAGYWLGDKITGEHSRYRVSISPETVTLTVNL